MSTVRSEIVTRKVVPATQAHSKTYAWHAHSYSEVLTVIGSTEDGISDNEAQARLKKHGPNEFSETPGVSVFARIFEQLTSPLAFVLVIAFAITLSLQEFVDAGVIGFALAIAVIVGVLQEGKASAAFETLRRSQVHTATVIREGKKHQVQARDVVVGDVIEIEGGAQVPADVRLIFAKKFAVNEAALTGEWLAVKKHTDAVPVGAALSDQRNMAFMGTFAASGVAHGVVVATGDRTAIGTLASDLSSIEDTDTPLQTEMRRVSMLMLWIIMGLVAAIFAIGLWQGQTVHDMVLMSIAVAVASVPEGLPAAVTIILAVGMEALLKRGGLVRNLLAAETLGSTTYILTDKTGTLTQAKMAVTGVLHGSAENFDTEDWRQDTAVRRIIDIALCASNAYRDTVKGEAVLRGEPVERAILQTAIEMDIYEGAGALRSNRIDLLPFSSENRFAAGLSEVKEGTEFRLCINGAPEYLLAKAGRIQVGDELVPLNKEKRAEIIGDIEREMRLGKRLIGVAYKEVDFDDIPDEMDTPSDLLQGTVFAGVLVLTDPVRKGVKEAIAGVKGAGAEVILVTGDTAPTALAIARSVGIAAPSENALTGSDLEDLTDEEILAVLDTVHVFARVLPQQKLRLARLLQQQGEVVAMTGDGINDAPALKKANIGIAIGSGTEVAKESSDLVLLNDSFATIHAAIEEGRRVIANLRKIVGYLLSTSLSEVVLIGAALITGGPIPILPAQILWANIIEEGLMSVAFAFEPGEKNAMKQRPQDIHEEGVLSSQMMWFMAFVITILSSMSLVIYFYFQMLGVSVEELRSVMFLAIAMDSLFIAFAFRSLTTPVWRIPLHTNLFFIGSFLLSLGLLAIALTIPFMQYVLSYQPLPAFDIAVVLGASAVSLVMVEVGKWVFFERQSRG